MLRQDAFVLAPRFLVWDFPAAMRVTPYIQIRYRSEVVFVPSLLGPLLVAQIDFLTSFFI